MKASLQFPNQIRLLEFLITTKVNYYQINREDHILVAKVTEAEIELALGAFEAKLINITHAMTPRTDFAKAI